MKPTFNKNNVNRVKQIMKSATIAMILNILLVSLHKNGSFFVIAIISLGAIVVIGIMSIYLLFFTKNIDEKI